MQLEAECRSYENQNQKEMDENYRFKMTLDKGVAFGALHLHRHDRDTKLIADLRKEKQEENDRLVAAREKTQSDYMAMAELQALINEGNKYKEEIEVMHVKHEHLNIKIKEMADGTEYLQEKKEVLDAEKKETDERNEDLEKQLRAKEEANLKRLLAKLQRDKNPEIKDLIAKEESQ